MRERLDHLLVVFSPWDWKPLTYREFANLIGASEPAVKSWYKRARLSKQGAVAILEAGERFEVQPLTMDWLLRGAGHAPLKGARLQRGGGQETRSGPTREEVAAAGLAVSWRQRAQELRPYAPEAATAFEQAAAELETVVHGERTIGRPAKVEADLLPDGEARARAEGHPERQVAERLGGQMRGRTRARRTPASGQGDPHSRGPEP